MYFLRSLGEKETAEDLAQDTLVSAWEALVRFRGDASFRTWLFAIARRKLAEHLRRVKRSFELEPPPPTADATDRMAVEGVLGSLATIDREAIVLCDVLGFEPSEAAAVAGVTPNAFRVRLHRARRRFKERYQDG